MDSSWVEQKIRELQAAVNKVYRQALLVIGRGRINIVNDAGVVQFTQVQLGPTEVRDETPNVQQYGFASNAPPGTDAILVFIAGDRSNGCIIATNNQTYRIKNLESGGVALYDKNENTIILNSEGITLTSPIAIQMVAPNIRIHATSVLKYDADGNGTTFTGTTRTDYVIGSTGSSVDINPPETP